MCLNLKFINQKNNPPSDNINRKVKNKYKEKFPKNKNMTKKLHLHIKNKWIKCYNMVEK